MFTHRTNCHLQSADTAGGVLEACEQADVQGAAGSHSSRFEEGRPGQDNWQGESPRWNGWKREFVLLILQFVSKLFKGFATVCTKI